MITKALLEEPVIHINEADPPVSGASTMVKLSNGNILVAWISSKVDFGTDVGSSHNYHAQIYAPDGTRVGAEFVINNQVTGYQTALQLAPLSNGGFVAAWTTEATGGSSSNSVDVHARLFTDSGAPLGLEFIVNSGLAGVQNAKGVVATPDGGFAVLYEDTATGGGSATGLHLQAFTSTGATTGADVTLQPQVGNVITLHGGNLLVVWSETVNGALDVKARIFASTGTALSEVFTVNQDTAGSQGAANAVLLSDGRFVVVWGDSNNGAVDVEMRIFNADGTPAGDEVLVNTITDGLQGNPIVTAMGDGGFVVSWSDNPTTFTPTGDLLYYLSGQRFDVAGSKQGDQFSFEVPTYLINGHGLTGLEDGRVAMTWAPVLVSFPPGGGTGTVTDASAYLRFIDFTDANAAPQITWLGGGDVANIALAEDVPSGAFVWEHAFGRIAASDPNGDRLTFALSGEDAALFSHDPLSGRLVLNQSVNFETPRDFDRDNVYRVTITVSDGITSDTQELAITVTNVIDGVSLTGTDKGNSLSGTEREDSLSGLGGNDTLRGLSGDDSIDGGMGNDTITGGEGADILTGGFGRDTFGYANLSDSQFDFQDFITDFSRAQGDRISLSAIDANLNRARDQSFNFIGSAEFGQIAGQLRYYYADGSTFVTGDVDGDGLGDFLIQLDGTIPLTGTDFIL